MVKISVIYNIAEVIRAAHRSGQAMGQNTDKKAVIRYCTMRTNLF